MQHRNASCEFQIVFHIGFYVNFSVVKHLFLFSFVLFLALIFYFSNFIDYSFDVRGRQFSQAKLWSSPTVFGARAFFSTANEPAQLKVDNIQLADEGVYRCRVDFGNSPTRNLKINLTVIGK